MQRIVRGLSATLSHTFYSDGVATDPSPDSATVTITRDNGTAVVTDAATTNAGTGVVTYTLTPAQTATLDILSVAWTATFGGQAQAFIDVVEVAGDVLFTVAQARALKPLDNTTTYTTQRILDARTMAETALEDACKVAFVPRYFRVTLDGRGSTDLLLPMVRPLTVTAATIDDAAVTVDDVELYDDGRAYLPSGWTAGRRNVTITGTHGYQFPPPRVGRAALLLAKRFLVDSPVSDRATSMTTEDGTTQFLVTAGVRQAATDVPEANAVIDEYGVRGAFTVA